MDAMDQNLPLKGTDCVQEKEYNERLNLYEGTYSMEGNALDVLIWKGADTSKKTFDLLRNFRHETAIPMLDFYYGTENEVQKGCIVIPKVVQSGFVEWFKAQEKCQLFDKTCKFTDMFRAMIIDICDLLEHLAKKKLYLKNLNIDDLYIQITSRGPKLLVLLTEVQMIKNPPKDHLRNKIVKDLIDWCSAELGVRLNDVTTSFVGFILAQNFTVINLKSYPDIWGYEKKGDFLLLFDSAKQTTGRKFTKLAKIQWPRKVPRLENEDSKLKLELKDLPEILAAMVQYDQKASYDLNIPFDYVRLLRNTYKHFHELADIVKDLLKSQKGLIDLIDTWSPNFWAKLYDHSGPYPNL